GSVLAQYRPSATNDRCHRRGDNPLDRWLNMPFAALSNFYLTPIKNSFVGSREDEYDSENVRIKLRHLNAGHARDGGHWELISGVFPGDTHILFGALASPNLALRKLASNASFLSIPMASCTPPRHVTTCVLPQQKNVDQLFIVEQLVNIPLFVLARSVRVDIESTLSSGDVKRDSDLGPVLGPVLGFDSGLD
ncbi:hypothetical protein EVAR_59114_1, partial [Eumeta japonica]